MKYLATCLIVSALLFAVGCDDKKDNRDTRSCWSTVDESLTYYPKGHGLKLLKHYQVVEINCFLNSGTTYDEYEESQFRTICTSSKWVLTSYGAPPHQYWPFQVKIGEVWVDRLKPVTIELQTKHCPKPDPKASWHPLSKEEIAEMGDSYDHENPNHWGYWIYTEVACPCED